MNNATMRSAIAVAALLFAGLAAATGQSYRGITCDDVRGLSAAGRDYWSKRLNLSTAQRHRIEVSCLQINHRGRGDTAIGLSEDVVNK
jgi:hypothetical protein